MLARETLWHGLQKMALRFLDWIQSWLGVARNHPLHVTATRCHHPSPRSALSGSCSTLHVLFLLFSIPGKSKIYL